MNNTQVSSFIRSQQPAHTSMKIGRVRAKKRAKFPSFTLWLKFVCIKNRNCLEIKIGESKPSYLFNDLFYLYELNIYIYIVNSWYEK